MILITAKLENGDEIEIHRLTAPMVSKAMYTYTKQNVNPNISDDEKLDLTYFLVQIACRKDGMFMTQEYINDMAASDYMKLVEVINHDAEGMEKLLF